MKKSMKINAAKYGLRLITFETGHYDMCGYFKDNERDFSSVLQKDWTIALEDTTTLRTWRDFSNLQIYRPCIKLWFYDTEWFFYPPKIMISGIDFFICHWDFRSDKHVIPSKFQEFFYEILIHSDFNFSIRIVSFFVCSGKNYIFCRVTVFWALCLWSFFCYLKFFNFFCFSVFEFIFKLIYTFLDTV